MEGLCGGRDGGMNWRCDGGVVWRMGWRCCVEDGMEGMSWRCDGGVVLRV